jgi:hypothetical protein
MSDTGSFYLGRITDSMVLVMIFHSFYIWDAEYFEVLGFFLMFSPACLVLTDMKAHDIDSDGYHH